MPKQVFKIDKFHGGINEASDARDISDDQMVTADGIDVSRYGKFRLLGRFEQWGDFDDALRTDAAGDPETTDPQIGSGLLAFSADWKGGSVAGTDQTNIATMQVETDYIAVWDNVNSRVYIWESTAGAWGLTSAGYVEPGGSCVGPTMYVIDGGLRVVDGNSNSSFKNRMLMPIKRQDFYNSGSPTNGYYEWSEWNWSEQICPAPDKPTVGTSQDYNGSYRIQDDNTIQADYEGIGGNDDVVLAPYVTLNCVCDEDAGLWNVHALNFWYSYVYEGMQESALTVMYNGATEGSLDLSAIKFEVLLRVNTDNTGTDTPVKHNFATWNENGKGTGPRIIGVRIYFNQSITMSREERFLLWEGLFEKGYRWADKIADHEPWGSVTLTGVTSGLRYAKAEFSEYFKSPFDVETYSTINGYDPGEVTTAKFKTAVVANRVVYAGNVLQDGQYYPDRILKSAVNKFDLFPESRFLDVTVNDGDSIIALMEFGDRILQFKSRSVSIINIQSGQEFLEGTYQFKGLISPAGAFKTEFGVVWANENGCYLYDGRQIHNLLEKGSIRIISNDTWSTFIQDPVVGYAPKFNKIIVRPEASNTLTSDGDAYIYDTVTKAWTRTIDNVVSHGSMSTNFQVDHNKDLIYAFGHASAPDGHMMKWNDDPAGQTSMQWISQDFDFGTPAVRKKVYKVYITYKSPNSAGGVSAFDGISVAGSHTMPNSADEERSYEITQTSSQFSGTGVIVKLDVPASGTLVDSDITVVDGGRGYANNEVVTFTDPQDNTGTFTYAVNGVADRVPILTYGVNGGTPTESVTGVFSADQTGWTRGEFTFGSSARSCYSIQLKISGNAINFEINDLSLIYRVKTVN